MANGHGGARENAGRKSKAEKYASEIETIERGIVDHLPELLRHQLALATGGAERVEKCYELSLGILVDDTAENPSGAIVKIKRQLFPDAGPEDRTLVSEKVITPEPDRAAIEYLIDRILGKPTAAVELTGADGAPLTERPDLSRLSKEELVTMLPLLAKAAPTLADHDADTDGAGDPDDFADGAGG